MRLKEESTILFLGDAIASRYQLILILPTLHLLLHMTGHWFCLSQEVYPVKLPNLVKVSFSNNVIICYSSYYIHYITQKNYGEHNV